MATKDSDRLLRVLRRVAVVCLGVFALCGTYSLWCTAQSAMQLEQQAAMQSPWTHSKPVQQKVTPQYAVASLEK